MELEKMLRHMAWANQEIISKVAEMPDAALDSYIVNPQWTAREIIRHIASSATWYGWRLMDKTQWDQATTDAWQKKLDLTEIQPQTSKDIAISLQYLRDADAVLLEESRRPEGDVLREWEGRQIIRKRSTIIAQSIHHATEHRAQLVDALEFKGFTGINLDDFDVWGFADTIGE
jgi:uncharacterized damage-inducible protein DinB